MHHPEQFKVIVKETQTDRLKEGLVSQRIARSKPTAGKWRMLSGNLVAAAMSAKDGIRSVRYRLHAAALRSNISQPAAQNWRDL